MKKCIIDWMENRLCAVAKAWGVTPDTAAKILDGPEYRDFWKSVNADEFLSMRKYLTNDASEDRERNVNYERELQEKLAAMTDDKNRVLNALKQCLPKLRDHVDVAMRESAACAWKWQHEADAVETLIAEAQHNDRLRTYYTEHSRHNAGGEP